MGKVVAALERKVCGPDGFLARERDREEAASAVSAEEATAKRGVCVYCGSNAGIDPAFADAADALGAAIAGMSARLVFGGGSRGLMGRVARAAMAAGGEVVGVIPGFLMEKEQATNDWTESVIVENMHQRKQTMFDRADAFVALPGGVGTLEEVVEQMTWAQLDRHNKPIVFADIGGFWRPLLDLFAHMRMSGFIRSDFEAPYVVAERIGDIPEIIQRAWAYRAG